MTDNTPKQPNRIPFESITTLERWPLPRMGEGERATPVAKKAKKEKPSEPGKERIEDVTEPVSHKPLTAEQLNQITEAAEKEGYQAGFEKGLAEGLAEGEQKGEEQGRQQAYQATYTAMEEERVRLYHIANALMAPLEQQDQAVENTIVDIAVGLAKHILQQELAQDPSALYGVVSQTLSGLPMGAKNIRIYLNPEDVPAAESLFEHEKSRGWEFLGDKNLQRGGCRAETADSLVDYSVERRLRDYLEAVHHGGEKAADHVEPVADFRAEEGTASPTAAETSDVPHSSAQSPVNPNND